MTDLVLQMNDLLGREFLARSSVRGLLGCVSGDGGHDAKRCKVCSWSVCIVETGVLLSKSCQDYCVICVMTWVCGCDKVETELG